MPAAALDDVFGWFRRVDELFSTWRPDSEITQLGNGELGLADATGDVREVLALCDEMRARTWGAFDIAVGSDPRVQRWEGLGRLDPSGLVKGWALDRAAAMLRAAGAANFSLNAGGDVLVAGDTEPGRAWNVGIQHPSRHDRVACTVSVSNAGIATSGRYERGDHVIDPRTGAPATALVSTTVIDPSLAIADALATGLLALGVDATRWLDAHPDVAAYIISADGTTSWTAPFDAMRNE